MSAPLRRTSRKVAPLLDNNNPNEEGSSEVLKKVSESQPRASFLDVSNPKWTPATSEGTKASIIQQEEMVTIGASSKEARHSLQSAVVVEASRVYVIREKAGEPKTELNHNETAQKIVSEEKTLEQEMEMTQTRATPVDVV